MVVNKRKKVTRYRAHTTHGGGHRKKRRGAGNRGGKGNAGSGKRGKAKKPSFEPLGQHGFLPPGQKKDNRPIINLSDLSRIIKNKKITEVKGIYSLNLTEMGYRKLLSTGETNLKLNIIVENYSKQTEEKILAKGGNITSPKKKSEEKIEE